MSIRIRVGEFKIGDEEKRAVNEVLESGKISEGEKVRKFEQLFAEYIGTKHAVAVSSGTSALISGMEAVKNKFKIRPKAKVITTPITYIATSNALVLTGFEPVYVDIDEEKFVITPDNIRVCLEEASNTGEYAMVLPVHLMGYPCDMEKINKIARKYGLIVFEDSAQAHGTVYKSKRTGSLSLLAGFSFYIAHNIQAGELGAVTTNDYDIIRLIKKIKANGRLCDCPVCLRAEGKCPKILSHRGDDDFDPRFTHELIGYNFKTMEFQAALASVQLKKADDIKEKRSRNVKIINEGLEQFSDLLQIPKYDKNVSYMAYPLVIRHPESISRKKLRAELEKLGIETRPLFGCIPTQQPAYYHMSDAYKNKLPNAEFVGKNGFYIGCHQYLTGEDLDYIVKCFKEIIKV
jgi:dTDP-4-amino-4,6-dideoxygalactose transaminase